MVDISLSREQASLIIEKLCLAGYRLFSWVAPWIMIGVLLLSFHMLFFCSAIGEAKMEDIRTMVEEDRRLANMIMFETIFRQIIQNSLQLPIEVAGKESKSKSALTVRKSNNARTKAAQGFVSNNEKLDKEGDNERLDKESNKEDEAKMGRRQTLARHLWLGRKGLRIM